MKLAITWNAMWNLPNIEINCIILVTSKVQQIVKLNGELSMKKWII